MPESLVRNTGLKAVGIVAGLLLLGLLGLWVNNLLVKKLFGLKASQGGQEYHTSDMPENLGGINGQ